MARIERKKINAVGFASKQVKPQTQDLKTVPVPPKPKHNLKVSRMFSLKQKLLSWGVKIVAVVPEKYIWKFISEVLDRLKKRIEDSPSWIKVSFVLLDNIIDALHPDSDGGYMVTKDELHSIIEKFWNERESKPSETSKTA